MDNQTKASNPARLVFSLGQYLRCYPAMLLTPVGAFALGLTSVFLKDFSLGLGVGVGIIFAFIPIPTVASSMKRRMQEGNLCAAVVVCTAPYTVAVLANLSTGDSRPKLAVKIKVAPLSKMFGGPPKLGAKLPASSHYFGETETESWKDFNPEIAQCACTDQDQIKRALNAIDPTDWQILEQAMKSLKPTALGLHHL